MGRAPPPHRSPKEGPVVVEGGHPRLHAGQDSTLVDARRRGLRRRDTAYSRGQDPENRPAGALQRLRVFSYRRPLGIRTAVVHLGPISPLATPQCHAIKSRISSQRPATRPPMTTFDATAPASQPGPAAPLRRYTEPVQLVALRCDGWPAFARALVVRPRWAAILGYVRAGS